jgi:hypothetical protein
MKLVTDKSGQTVAVFALFSCILVMGFLAHLCAARLECET